MARPILLVVVVLLSSLAAACGGTSPAATSAFPSTPLVLAASPETVVADGTSSMTISVSGPAQGEVSIWASRGRFSNGNLSTRVSALPATVTLFSCDASKDSACAGTTLVRAADSIGTFGELQVLFTAGSGPVASCSTCGATACIGVVCDALGHTCSSGSPSTCSTCPGGTAEICGDGVDNNCDGLVDCADPQCQPVGNALGAVCDAVGHTCSVKGVTGASTCTICSGNGGTPEARESSCGDGKDNDCDGLVDCQDPDCAGLTCSTGGLTCSPTALTCSVCPGGQAVETTCGDGKDNDCNGLIDCKDPACQPTASGPGKACGAFGQTCTGDGGGTCACSGNGGVAQAVETSCGDGFDNDCNGKIDCEDSSCSGRSCDRNGSVGKVCASGICTCPGGTAEVCNDGIDNDCNGKIDCQDLACQPAGDAPGASCDTKGNRCSAPTATAPSTCSVCSGNGGVAQAVETSCSDGFDNDCDGRVDCADPNCLGQACSAANPGYVCLDVGGTTSCTDPSVRYTLELAPARSRIPADGSATTSIVATLKNDGVPLAGKTLAFSTTLAGTALSPAAPTDANGQTTVVFRSTDPASGGDATIRATYVASPTVSVSGTTVVSLPRLGQVNLLTQQYDILGVRSSEYQETSVLTFQLLDSSDLPYPAGLAVEFTHVSLSQSFIGLTQANCSNTFPVVCSLTGTTDDQGRVQVLLNSGYAAGVVSVAAGAAAGGASASGTASNIAIVGAKASGAHITVECYDRKDPQTKPQIFPAFADADCSFSHLMEIADCRVALADRFNNVLGVSTLTQFFSEAGTAGPAAFTLQYDPSKTPAAQSDLGLAVSYVRTDGKLPRDVRPFGGEGQIPYRGACPVVEGNPRDGLATVIVVVNGEEGFVDLNGNGEYDPGEPFIDMGEPFIDENDDGVWQAGEFFVDLNHNGVRDAPDGQWNRNTVIWAETRILFTGSYANARFYSGDLAAPSPVSSFVVDSPTPGPATSQKVLVNFSDASLNLPVGTGTPTFSVTSSNGHAAAAYSVGPAPAEASRLNQVMTFTQQYCSEPNLGSTCSNVCPTAPCYVVTNVGACNAARTTCTGFSYGASGQVTITGVSAGTDTVTATVTAGGGAASVSLPGVVR